MLSLICTSSPKGMHETGCNARSTLALVVHTKPFQNLEHQERHSCSCGGQLAFLHYWHKTRIIKTFWMSFFCWVSLYHDLQSVLEYPYGLFLL